MKRKKNTKKKKCNCEKDEQFINEVTPPTPKNTMKIFGKVTYNNQGIHLAKVIITEDRQVVAEALTDCDGKYEFTGEKANYRLRAYKGNRKSSFRATKPSARNAYEVNFKLL